jgi:hypothetical protein
VQTPHFAHTSAQLECYIITFHLRFPYRTETARERHQSSLTLAPATLVDHVPPSPDPGSRCTKRAKPPLCLCLSYTPLCCDRPASPPLSRPFSCCAHPRHLRSSCRGPYAPTAGAMRIALAAPRRPPLPLSSQCTTLSRQSKCATTVMSTINESCTFGLARQHWCYEQ